MPYTTNYGRRFDATSLGCAGFAVIAAIVLLVIAVPLAISYAKVSEQTLHITGKESVSVKDGHEYRVYADEDTYVIKDSFIHPRFNSANVYGRLPVPAGGPGSTKSVAMRCKVYGWRIGLFSQFKNILECKRLVPAPEA
jgi:hypothetical protein